MKHRVFEYIKNHGPLSVNEISAALNIPGCEIMKIIEDLRAKSVVRMTPPRSLGMFADNSCFYEATGKAYRDE